MCVCVCVAAVGDTNVTIGLAICSPTDPNPEGFYTRSESELAQMMTSLETPAEAYSSFDGFAVFFGVNWVNQTAAHPAPSGTVFQKSAVW